MTSKERVKRALKFNFPDRVPRDLWKLPGIDFFRKKDLEEVLSQYPLDIERIEWSLIAGKNERMKGERYRKNKVAIDEWGCEWQTAEDGVAGEVKNPPLKKISDVRKLQPPYDVLETALFSRVNTLCQSDKFVLGWSSVRPFERMQFLLGTEQLFIELHYLSEELYLLRDILHRFYLEELRLWSETEVDGVSFMDDWGSQKSLLISPLLWRSFFKPLYKEYCDLLHSKGKFVFFHSDGFIEPLFPDLIEIGVDAINCQLFCMNIKEIGKKFRGKITFWGEIDRQRILPFGTEEEIARAVKRIRDTLWLPQGGVIAQCEFGLKDPVKNIIAVFRAWEKGCNYLRNIRAG